MSIHTINLTLEENITRAALLTLISGDDVIPKRRYRITDAVSSTLVIIVIGFDDDEVTDYAINESQVLFGLYDIGLDVFTPTSVLQVIGDSVGGTTPYPEIIDNSVTMSQTAHGFVVGDWLYITGGTPTKAIATSEAASNVIGMVTHVINANSYRITSVGHISTLSGLAGSGLVYFLSATTAGLMTTTEPTTIGQYSKILFISKSSTSGWIVQSRAKLIINSNYPLLYGRVNGSYVLTSTTSAQKLLDISTNGAVDVEAGTVYEFECMFDITGLSSSSGAVGFGFGGTATITSAKMSSVAVKAGSLGANNCAMATSATSSITITGANTSANCQALVKGRLVINAAGTLVPQVILGVAIAATVTAGAYFKLRKLGVANTYGTWS